MIEERPEKAAVREQNYQQAAAHYYDSNIRNRAFSVGNLVLRKVFDGTKEPGAGKLGTRWEGPYKVTKEIRTEVYKLGKWKTGLPEMRPWKAYNLKTYYKYYKPEPRPCLSSSELGGYRHQQPSKTKQNYE